jgi:hypothetical protein
LTPASVLRVAAGVAVQDALLLPKPTEDPRAERLVRNMLGDRFQLTRELDATLRILAREVSGADAAAELEATCGPVGGQAGFDRWVRLLGVHALVEWRAPASDETSREHELVR